MATFIPGSIIYSNMEQALEYAGSYTYSAYHAAFPDKLLTTSIGRVTNYNLNPGGADNYGRNISEKVVSDASISWPGFIIAQKNNLNGGGQLPGGGGVPPAPPPEAKTLGMICIVCIPFITYPQPHRWFGTPGMIARPLQPLPIPFTRNE